MNPLAGPMTQQRSRLLGRLLMAAAGLKVSWYLRGLRRRSVLASVLLAPLVLVAAGLLLWVGTTLSVMNWDNPADYPPADPTALDD